MISENRTPFYIVQFIYSFAEEAITSHLLTSKSFPRKKKILFYFKSSEVK